MRAATALFALLVTATSSDASFFELTYDADSGLDLVNDLGFQPFGENPTIQIVSSAGVAGLGASVGRLTVNGARGGFAFDLDGHVSSESSFEMSMFIRGGAIEPQGPAGLAGDLTRYFGDGDAVGITSPGGSGAIPSGVWFFVEVSWDGGSNTGTSLVRRLNEVTGELEFVTGGEQPATFFGSPDAVGNAFGIRAANNGSTLIQYDFDQLTFREVPAPGTGLVPVVATVATLRRPRRHPSTPE